MSRCSIIILLWLSWAFVATAEPSPISILLDKDYPRTLAIQLNGHFVPSGKVLESLSSSMKDKQIPVVVLMPGKVAFNDWGEIRGLLDKVGFLNVRYFVYSSATHRMTEIELPLRAVQFSVNPAPRSSGN